jgi:hypothetical protein
MVGAPSRTPHHLRSARPHPGTGGYPRPRTLTPRPSRSWPGVPGLYVSRRDTVLDRRSPGGWGVRASSRASIFFSRGTGRPGAGLLAGGRAVRGGGSTPQPARGDAGTSPGGGTIAIRPDFGRRAAAGFDTLAAACGVYWTVAGSRRGRGFGAQLYRLCWDRSCRISGRGGKRGFRERVPRSTESPERACPGEPLLLSGV